MTKTTKILSVFSDTRHGVEDGALLIFFFSLTESLTNELCESYGAWPTHFVCMHVTEFCNVSYRLINSIQCSPRTLKKKKLKKKSDYGAAVVD